VEQSVQSTLILSARTDPYVADMTLSANESSYDFGTVLAHAAEEWTLEVGNTGPDTLRVEISTALPFTAEPEIFTVPQGCIQAVRVLYQPLAAGSHIRPLNIRSNDPNQPQSIILLRGEATSEQPKMRLNASNPYNFGPQRLGSMTEWTFTVSNPASAADTLRVKAVRVYTPFSVSMNSFKVGPGGSQPIAVSYSPPALGTFEKTLVIVSNDPHTPHRELRLQGSTTDPGPSQVEVVLGTPLQLTQHPAADSAPTWSPDGTRIAFVSNRDGNEEIYTIDADGENLTNLTQHPAADSAPTWSPDGTRIAFISEYDGNRGLYVMNGTGENRTDLTRRPAWNNSPAWSPDGTHIAFQAYRYSTWDIYVVNAAGGNPTRLTQRGHNDTPVWSPDGTRIAFMSNRDGNREIYCIDANGQTLINLTRNSIPDQLPAWSPDGTHIAFISNRSDGTNIYIVDAYAGLHITRLPWKAWDEAPLWSPNGTRIAFISDRDSRPKLYVVEAELAGPQITSVAAEATPARFFLHPNAPNPFNPTTLLSYGLPQAAAVELDIYNMLGQRMVRLVDEAQSGGHHQMLWDGRDAAGRPVASGIYLYRLLVRPLSGGPPQFQTRRMVLVR